MTLADQLWSDPGRLADVAVRTAAVYVVALLLVRLAGRRTLAQLSAFDVLVTIAAGSVVASTALPPQPRVADGVAVLATLMLLQVLLGAVRQRVPVLRRLVDFAPRVVVQDGAMETSGSPASAQLTRDELEAALRRQGVQDLASVRIAVLEPNGKVSVLPAGGNDGGLFALRR